MRNIFTKVIMIAGLAVFAGCIYASPPVDKDGRAREPISVVKKKKAGEECKTSDECKRHHTCSKDGDKNVCTAPTYSEIPKT